MASKERTVEIYTWWQSASGTRQFAIVAKFGQGTGHEYRTTQLQLLEVGKSSPISHSVEDFFLLVDQGHLVDMNTLKPSEPCATS